MIFFASIMYNQPAIHFFTDKRYIDIFPFIIVSNFILLKIHHLNDFYCFKISLVSIGNNGFPYDISYICVFDFADIHPPCQLPLFPRLSFLLVSTLSICMCLQVLVCTPVHVCAKARILLLSFSSFWVRVLTDLEFFLWDGLRASRYLPVSTSAALGHQIQRSALSWVLIIWTQVFWFWSRRFSHWTISSTPFPLLHAFVFVSPS